MGKYFLVFGGEATRETNLSVDRFCFVFFFFRSQFFNIVVELRAFAIIATDGAKDHGSVEARARACVYGIQASSGIGGCCKHNAY